MAGQTCVNASDLVLFTETVITQEHSLRKCQSVWHKINKFFSKIEMVLGFRRSHLPLFSYNNQKHKVRD